jgi:hypothetical protein
MHSLKTLGGVWDEFCPKLCRKLAVWHSLVTLSVIVSYVDSFGTLASTVRAVR